MHEEPPVKHTQRMITVDVVVTGGTENVDVRIRLKVLPRVLGVADHGCRID